MRTLRTTGSGNEQTLNSIEGIKIPVYDTTADAEADLANLAEGQIVATKDAGGDEQTLFEYVDGRLETTTTEIAMDVFKTGSKAYLNKSGNNVQLRYWADGDISTFNPIARETNVLIGTIPNGFRPKQKLVLNSDNNVPNSPDYASTLVTIETNGGIYIWIFGQNPLPPNFGINVDYNIDSTNSNFMSVNTLKDAKDYTDEQNDYFHKKYVEINAVNIETTLAAKPQDKEWSIIFTNNSTTGSLVTVSGQHLFFIEHKCNYDGKCVEIAHAISDPCTYERTWQWWNDSWSPWASSVIHHDILSNPPSGTTLNDMWNKLSYELINTDWTFLTSINNTVAMGKFAMVGHYQGMYTAHHSENNNVTVQGTICPDGVPHAFTAFHDAAEPIWRINIDGHDLIHYGQGFIVTRKIVNDWRKKYTVTGRGLLSDLMAIYSQFGLYGRLTNGQMMFAPNTALSTNNKYIITNDSAYTAAWPANAGWWLQKPVLSAPNTTEQNWLLEWWNGQLVVSNVNMWGVDAALSVVDIEVEIIA